MGVFDFLFKCMAGYSLDDLDKLEHELDGKTIEEKTKLFEEWIGMTMQEVDEQTIILFKNILIKLQEQYYLKEPELKIALGAMRTGVAGKWRDFRYVFHQTDYVRLINGGTYFPDIKQFNIEKLFSLLRSVGINISDLKTKNLPFDPDGGCFDYLILSSPKENINEINNGIELLEKEKVPNKPESASDPDKPKPPIL